MIKRILVFTLIVFSLLAISFFIHDYTLVSSNIYVSYPLLNVYLFHAIAASIVYIMIEVLAEKLPNQAGYAYLAAIFLKIGLFVLIFQESIMANDSLSKPERISLVVPLFLFLILEAVAVSKLLNSK